MNKPVKFSVLGLLLSLSIYSGKEIHAQYFDQNKLYNRSIAASPNASSLSANTNVNLYTGTPGINIPLYTVSTGKLSLPISLSYNASGIKVDQIASWVGLGWSLNAGGAITRTVKGNIDELSTDYCEGYLVTTDQTNLYERIASGEVDAQPDLYHFNVGGYSGKFFFTQSKEIRTVPKMPVKIEYNEAPVEDQELAFEISAFTIITPDGIRYTYDKTEETTRTVSFDESPEINYATNPEKHWEGFSSSLEYETYYSAWYLTEISDPYGTNIILLDYEAEKIIYSNRPSEVFSCYNEQGYYEDFTVSRILNTTNVDGWRLYNINWNGNNMNFVASEQDRLDISNIDNYKGKALDRIEIFDYNDNPIKSFDFNHSYFQSFGIPDSDIEDTHPEVFNRLKLESIQESGWEFQNKLPPTTFKYNGTRLPYRFSSQIDYWGFYTSNASDETARPKVYVYPGGQSNNIYRSIYSIFPRGGTNYYRIGESDRSADLTGVDTKACILEKIIYPFGGSVNYNFEPHEFNLSGSKIIGGGLRIESIISRDHLNFLVKSTYYIYDIPPESDDDIFSSGKITSVPDFCKTNSYQIDIYNGENEDTDYYKRITTYYSQSQVELGITHGSHVGYQKVKVYDGNPDLMKNGYVEYNYDFPATAGASSHIPDGYNISLFERDTKNIVLPEGCNYNSLDNFPYIPSTDYDWYRGSLKSSIVYNAKGDPVTETSYEYKLSSHYSETYGHVAAMENHEQLLYSNYHNGQNITVIDCKVVIWGSYKYISTFKHLKKQTVSRYDPNDATNKLTEETEYFYDNPEHMQLTEIKRTNSDGESRHTFFKYPLNYRMDYDCTVYDQEAKSICFMQENNIVTPVIETYTAKDIYKTDVISASITLFKEFNNGQILPYGKLSLKNKKPINNFTESTLPVGEYNIQWDENNYETDLYLEEYDEYGNLLQSKRPFGESSSVIMGYNNALPIAKAINAGSDEIIFENFENEIQKFNTNFSCGNSDWEYSGSEKHSGNYSLHLIDENDYRGKYYNVKINNIDLSGKYKFSAWVKNTSPSSAYKPRILWYIRYNNGSNWTYPGLYAKNTGEWEFLDKEIDLSNYSNITYIRLYLLSGPWTSSGSGDYGDIYFDDVRFHPSDAQMTTYTYDPLIGVSSETDANNRTTFYEYDDFGRLLLIKDNDGNIRKSMEYEYAGKFNISTDKLYFGNMSGYTPENKTVTVNSHVPWSVHIEENVGSLLRIENDVTSDNFVISCKDPGTFMDVPEKGRIKVTNQYGFSEYIDVYVYYAIEQ